MDDAFRRLWSTRRRRREPLSHASRGSDLRTVVLSSRRAHAARLCDLNHASRRERAPRPRPHAPRAPPPLGSTSGMRPHRHMAERERGKRLKTTHLGEFRVTVSKFQVRNTEGAYRVTPSRMSRSKQTARVARPAAGNAGYRMIDINQ